MANGGFSLVVITFDDENDARSAVKALRQLEKAGRLNIEDTAVIRRDADGKLHVDNQVDRSVKVGAAIGGMLGLIIGIDLLPDRRAASRRGRRRGRRKDDGDRGRQEIRRRGRELARAGKLGAVRHGERGGSGGGGCRAAAVQGQGLSHHALQRGRGHLRRALAG